MNELSVNQNGKSLATTKCYQFLIKKPFHEESKPYSSERFLNSNNSSVIERQ